jgi:uncharacterized protein
MESTAKPVLRGRLSDVCCDPFPDPVAQANEIAELLRAGAEVGETDKNGVTPLHHAVRFRSPAAVRALLAGGANANQTCKRSGSTALHRAATSTGAPHTKGKIAEAREIVALLLAAGADSAARNKLGKTPGEYATDEAIRKLFIERTQAGRTGGSD